MMRFCLIIALYFAMICCIAQQKPRIFEPILIPKEKSSIDSVYVVVEQMPVYPDGESEMCRFVAQNMKYPIVDSAFSYTLATRLIASFVINKEGDVTNVSIIRSIHPKVDSAYIHVIQSMPRWIPGRQNGKAVNVRYLLPMHIHLKR